MVNKTVATVCSSYLNYHHNPEYCGLTNRGKGFQRELIKGTLKWTKAFAFKSEIINMASPTYLDCGNMQDIKSDDVIRKIRSESTSTSDYDKDDFHDILLMYNDEKNGYVEHVSLLSI